MPRLTQRLQFAGQCVSPLGNVSGAEANDEVAGACEAANYPGEFGRTLQRNYFAMAVRAQAEHEMIAVDALDRRLAGRIDLGDNNRIGIVEAGTEFLEQRLQAGEAMRLNDGDDLAVGGFTRRFKDGGYLDRMVTVIVDHGDAVPLPGPGKAPLDAAEACHRLADRIVGHAELMRHRNSRGGVERVVTSRHRQHDVGDLMRSVGLAV